MLTSDDGHDPVLNVKKLKSTDMLLQHSLRFVHQMLASILFMSIQSVHCLHLHLSSHLRGSIYMVAQSDTLSSITAEAVAHAFLHGWISQFGVPSTIVTDRRHQFESKLWQTSWFYWDLDEYVLLLTIHNLMGWL